MPFITVWFMFDTSTLAHGCVFDTHDVIEELGAVCVAFVIIYELMVFKIKIISICLFTLRINQLPLLW